MFYRSGHAGDVYVVPCLLWFCSSNQATNSR